MVESGPAGRSTLSDAAGRFELSGLEPGRHELTARHVAYAPVRRSVEVENGRRATVLLALEPLPVPLGGLRVEVAAAEGRRVVAGDPGTAGARTAADLVRALPGVAVTREGPSGPETVSVRAGGAGAVLVLLDGVPVNDPVTGVADLSTVPASGLASATLLPGARAARWGAGAGAGVLLLETRGAGEPTALTAGAGALGRVDGGVRLSGDVAGLAWSAGADHARLDGRFDYALPASVGGGAGERRNADASRTSVRAGLEADAAGRLRVRALHDRQERGLPGRAFAPSPEARQHDARTQLSLGWSGRVGLGEARASAWGARRDVRHVDPRPPAGPPYDDATRADAWGVDAELRRGLAAAVELALGLDVDGQEVDADALTAPRSRTDGAARVGLSVGPLHAPGEPSLRATGRLHRDGRGGAWRGSHELAVAARLGTVAFDLAHRSAWTPPALADLFFRDGVAVEPNPDLAPERVPSEVEAGLRATWDAEWGTLRAGASAYRGDVDGMVVWAPDYRFVWSPRNVDVRRRGLEAWGEARLDRAVPGSLLVEASWSRARAVAAGAADPDLQLPYRPRHAATLAASWSGSAGGLSLEGRYTGLRHTAPTRVNTLPGFWAWDATARRTWCIAAWRVETRLRVERLLDSRDALVFGFPHPGRTLAVEVAVEAPRTLLSPRNDP